MLQRADFLCGLKDVIKIFYGETEKSFVVEIDIDDLLPILSFRDQVLGSFIEQCRFASAARACYDVIPIPFKGNIPI